MELINIGFGNLVSAQRLISIVGPDSAPVKRLIQESRDRGMLIDATYGRKTASVLIMDSDHVILSALSTEKLARVWGCAWRTSAKRTSERKKGRTSVAKIRQVIHHFRPVRRGQEHRAQGPVPRAPGSVFFRVRHDRAPARARSTAYTTASLSPSSSCRWRRRTSSWSMPSMLAAFTARPAARRGRDGAGARRLSRHRDTGRAAGL